MIIAVDTRGSEEYRNLIFQTFRLITQQHKQHSFFFLFDKSVDPLFIFSERITPIIIKTKISLLSQLEIAASLKKYKVDVFVTAQPINTNTTQCLIAFDNVSGVYGKKSKVIVAFSKAAKSRIIGKHKIDENKIDVVYTGADENFHSITWEEKEKIKEQYAAGNEFFLADGSTDPETLLNLLKAFSVFKKMQKSNMQLLIVTQSQSNEDFLKALQLYKFYSQVKIVDRKNNFAQLVAAAYAFISLSNQYTVALNAMLAGVPLITINTAELKEICGDTALYFNITDYKDIADKMMLVYKDENLKTKLIEKGKEQTLQYSWDNSAHLLWKSIEKAAN